MKLKLDANILIAALIKQNFAHNVMCSTEHEFYVPFELLNEINKYADEIKKRGKYNDAQLKEYLNYLVENLRFVQLQDKYIQLAKHYCPDEKDIHYFAVALQLNIPILSNDKRLKSQSFVKVIALHELEQS